MNWYEIAALVSGALTIIAFFPYVWDIFKGTTRPNAISWGLWTLIHIIFISAQLSAGASFSIVLPFGEFFGVALVTVLGLVGYGYKKYGLLDIVCLVCCLAAIVLWLLTNNPILALVLAIAADFCATIPTLKKAYFDPTSETMSAYILVIVAAVFAGLSSTLFNFANLAWPVYIFFINTLVVVFILLGRRLKKAPK